MSRRTAPRIYLSLRLDGDSSVEDMLDAIDGIEPHTRQDSSCEVMFEDDQRDVDHLIGSLRGRPAASY